MARYINADKFAEAICKFPAIDEHTANAVIFLLRKQPTADVVEVKHGEWEDLYKGKHDPLYTCSKCYCRALYKPETDEFGNIVFHQELSKVCPHCFAKMDRQ